jgi:hypothetical protein
MSSPPYEEIEMFRRDSTLQTAAILKLLKERLDNGDLTIIASQTGIDQTSLMDWYEDSTLVPTDDQLESLTFHLAAHHYRSEADRLSEYQRLNGVIQEEGHRNLTQAKRAP